MKRTLTFIVFLICLNIHAFAQAGSPSFDFSQYGVSIEPDKRLIVMMASLEVAGIQPKLTPRGEEFRKRIAQDLSGVNEDLVRRMKIFFEQYKRRHPKLSDAELIASFVSLAHVLSPVPELADPSRATDLPGDLLEVFDYAPLVREFYRRSGIEAKLPEYTAEYQRIGDQLRPSAREMIGDLLDYLHTKPELVFYETIKTQSKPVKGKRRLETTERRVRERRFFIVPDLLAMSETINFRNVRDDYYVIVPPDTDLSRSEARRAFLQFVTDILVLKNSREIAPFREGIRGLINERRAQGAEIAPDIYLAISRSLVAAIDAREIEFRKTQFSTAQAREKIDKAKSANQKKIVSEEFAKQKEAFADETALMLSDAYERGAVLSFYFAEQLKGLEDSGFDIAGSIREMILSMNPPGESQRLAQFAAARKRGENARELRRSAIAKGETVVVAEPSDLAKGLIESESLITKKDFAGAEARLKALLLQYPEEPRVSYAMGRRLSLLAQETTDEDLRARRLEDAARLYTTTLNSPKISADPALMSLAYVGLGRIYEYFDRKQLALKIYEAAIQLGQQSGGAYLEAVSGRQRLLKLQ